MGATVYATEDQFRARLDIPTGETVALVAEALSSASRWIDSDCRRRFYADDTATPQLFATPFPRGTLYLPDIADPDTVIVESGPFGGPFTTWPVDVELLPTSAPVGWPPTGWPRWSIGSPLQRWPISDRLQITAKWGCPIVPDPVVEATLILATRIWKRKGSPEGVAGFGEYGVVRLRADPDVDMLLEPYRLSQNYF